MAVVVATLALLMGVFAWQPITTAVVRPELFALQQAGLLVLPTLTLACLRIQGLAGGALGLAHAVAHLEVPAPFGRAGGRRGALQGLAHTLASVLIQSPPRATAVVGQPILAHAVAALFVQQFIWPTQRQKGGVLRLQLMF